MECSRDRPFAYKNTAIQMTRRAGAGVVMNERAGSHGGAFWREEFPLMVAWAFGRCMSVRHWRRNSKRLGSKARVVCNLL